MFIQITFKNSVPFAQKTRYSPFERPVTAVWANIPFCV